MLSATAANPGILQMCRRLRNALCRPHCARGLGRCQGSALLHRGRLRGIFKRCCQLSWAEDNIDSSFAVGSYCGQSLFNRRIRSTSISVSMLTAASQGKPERPRAEEYLLACETERPMPN